MTGGRLPHLLWLVAVWVALWGHLTAANVLGGVLAAAAVTAALREAEPGPEGTFRALPALAFLGFFAVALVRASVSVAARVLRPGHAPTPGIIAVPVLGQTDAVVTVIANVITLTPGTVTLEVRRDGPVATLYVHLLDLPDVDAARAELAELGARAVAAFGRPQAVQEVQP